MQKLLTLAQNPGILRHLILQGLPIPGKHHPGAQSAPGGWEGGDSREVPWSRESPGFKGPDIFCILDLTFLF